MQIKGIVWAGVRTLDAAALATFFASTLGISGRLVEEGMWIFHLPDGTDVEIFDQDYAGKSHFNTGPVVGFEVDDVKAATRELEAAGIELLGDRSDRWQHFRGPDGNIYELKRQSAKEPD